ncbi:MAG: glycosyltransferase [Lentisphaerae bacterium]|nr:glycosyltransferase [Lentisphaerota bacterium]
MSLSVNNRQLHEEFLASKRRHVLMITNHGIHEWEVVLGLPDTGGQCVYVNQLTAQLVREGFRVTILNRGGFPHPQTGDLREGLHYRDASSRILYLEDDVREFVRKEDMASQLPGLAEFYLEQRAQEDVPCDLIISNYWDAAALGVLINKALPQSVRHIWIPHSLGTVKKRNMPEKEWPRLRIDERIEAEKEVVAELDGVAATSALIRDALRSDYNCPEPLFLPPGVDVDRFGPREVGPESEIWEFLGRCSGVAPTEIVGRKIVCEISRTDRTKRKDVLIKAFAGIHKKHPDAFLVVALAEEQRDIYRELQELIDKSGLRGKTAVVGWAGDVLHLLYAVSAVYCTPSVMEGFGMAAQEAAATAVPVVASNLVPFVVEYLLGDGEREVTAEVDGRSCRFRLGAGGIVAPADDVDAFTAALDLLLRDDQQRKALGAAARKITVPAFTWQRLVRDFLQAVGEQA